jgi:Rieske Fe-S protein
MNPPPDDSTSKAGVSRRTVLGITVAGAAGLITAACGGSSSGAATDPAGSKTPSPAGSSPSPAGSSASSGGSSRSGLVAAADVPVGSGVFVKDGKIIAEPGPQEQLTAVVTQPTAGDFKAFTTTCTHMQCTVGTIKNGNIICPCHGSEYSIKDGSVTGGPAPKPLTTIDVKVDGDNVVKA